MSKLLTAEEFAGGAQAPAVSAKSSLLSAEEFAGTGVRREEKLPAASSLPSITKEIKGVIGEGQIDPKTGEIVNEGFFSNLKNPFYLWMKESLPANVVSYLSNKKGLDAKARQSLMEEQQDAAILKNPNAYSPQFILAAKERQAQRDAKKFSFSQMVKSAQEDPGRFGADLVNALVADPV